MKINLFLKTIFLLIIVSVLQSCTSSCKILSEPSDAEVYINGRYKGKTPYKFSTTISDETLLRINIQKKGFVSIDTIFYKNGKTNKINRVLGYILVFPFDYDRMFKKEYAYHLKQKTYNDFPENLDQETSNSVHENSKLLRLKNLQEAYKAGKYTEKEYKEIRKSIMEGKQ
ncbi:MAG: PEGA domain-containing protein [Saprospiraceae bacterium]|nr:PEGA domain-containing protein [Saprospiraceae bacterium]